MELINATRMVAGYTTGTEPSGRELLVVVVKGTFRIPAEPGATVRLHEKQVPLVMADVFHGEPGFSAPKYEVDFAPHKSLCDVVLIGSAYAPGGRPARRVPVGFRIGSLTKTFAVLGKRSWQAGLVGVRSSDPEPFITMPISYEYAFGGVDNRHEDPSKHAAFARNPVGKGFHQQIKREWIDGAPLPNTEELHRPVEEPNGDYTPMAFGCVGRNWQPRLALAGTYDQSWLDNVFPFLPPDFDSRYYQCACADQQFIVPCIDQEVTLVNLTTDGRRTFVLPYFEAPVYVFPRRGPREELKANLDTIVIEPDKAQLTMTWRVSRPLNKSIFEIAQILVGRKGKEWWQKRQETDFPIPVTTVPADSIAS